MADASDIVERLRFSHEHGVFDASAVGMLPDLIEAAAEIERLRGDLKLWINEAADRSEGMVHLNLDRAAMGVAIMQLKEALAPFAEAASNIGESEPDSGHMWEHPASMNVTAGDFRAAAKAHAIP